MKHLLVIIISVFLNIPFVYSTDYYFSISGDDDLNTGISSESPYKTISKLNTLTLQPGDRVFFNRGDIFNGQINVIASGSSSANIYFDAYGTGPNPLISGSTGVTNWKVYSGNIYVADVPSFPSDVNQLFVNASLMTPARFPNTGFLTIDSSSGKLSLSSGGLSQPSGYWNGANLIARTERWVYENREVADSKTGTLTLASPVSYSFKAGFGFYLNNKLSELDAEGEWYYDELTKRIYLMSPGLHDPNNLKIEASINNYGFNLSSQSYISINNLSICYQGLDGIYANNGNNISINNTSFSGIFRNGISTDYPGGNNIKIINNTFTDIGNNGIALGYSSSCTIKGNTLKKIALNAGMGGSGDWKYIGILGGLNSYIGTNTLDSIGYNGIYCQSGDTVINNIVKNTCMVKDDGASIYSYKSDHVIIKNNIIINSIGNGEATSKEQITYANGIYLDDSCSYVTLYQNTVINADYGFFIHNSFNNTFDDNVLYNNRKAQLALQSDHSAKKDFKTQGNNITGNVLYSLNPNQLCIYLYTYENILTDFGTFDKNYYCNPYSEILVKTISVPYYPAGTYQKFQTYRFADWKNIFTNDISSITSKVAFGKYYTAKAISANLISNSTFQNNINGWYSWGSSNYSTSLDSTNLLMSGSSLKSNFSDFTLNSIGNFANGNFPVVKGNYYKLVFKAISLKTSNLNFDITQNASPWKFSEINASFLLDRDTNNIEYIFESMLSISNARILFATTIYDSTAWIDNVSLMEISVDTNTSMPGTNSPIIINPTSSTKTVRLVGSFKDLNGKAIRRSVSIPPFSSKVYTSSSYQGAFRTAANSIPLPISNIIIYPVPSQQGNNIFVQYPDNTNESNADYFISDLSGREISRGSLALDDSCLIEIPTTGLPKGLSIIKLTTGTTVKTAKIILF
jgi:parallel beta-helix repeat protein